MNNIFSLGIDFGSNAVRLLVINLKTGDIVATVSQDYQKADKGVYYNPKDVNMARQDPNDYLDSLEGAMQLLRNENNLRDFNWNSIKGIGIDATGSTPIPVDEHMNLIANKPGFEDNLNAKAWMWKDHTSEAEAQEITRLAKELRPEYLKYCGGKYSSEWFWAKIFHCATEDPKVFEEAHTWVEFSDYIPAVLTGVGIAGNIKRNACAAGHKALFHNSWDGYPDPDFISRLHPGLLKVRETLPEKADTVDEIAGNLDRKWAEKLGLSEGIPVAMGALDAHVGAIGSGANNSTLIKIIGTSSCDIIVGDLSFKDIQGVSGVAEHSVLPGFVGIEAGQSAVGDIFKWFVVELLKKEESYHSHLIKEGLELNPGESGLIALDWNNGNRDVLSDPNLRGLILGQSLQTKDFEVYRSLIEGTAFGAKRIVDQLESGGVNIEQIICCGGIPQKNPLFMQIYADVLNRPIFIAQSNETVALGAAMIGGLHVLKEDNSKIQLTDLQKQFCKVSPLVYRPIPENILVYKELFEIYLRLHDAFGINNDDSNLFSIMKQLIQLKNKVTKG